LELFLNKAQNKFNRHDFVRALTGDGIIIEDDEDIQALCDNETILLLNTQLNDVDQGNFITIGSNELLQSLSVQEVSENFLP
jgi:hypothetical protein